MTMADEKAKADNLFDLLRRHWGKCLLLAVAGLFSIVPVHDYILEKRMERDILAADFIQLFYLAVGEGIYGGRADISDKAGQYIDACCGDDLDKVVEMLHENGFAMQRVTDSEEVARETGHDATTKYDGFVYGHVEPVFWYYKLLGPFVFVSHSYFVRLFFKDGKIHQVEALVFLRTV